METLLIIVLAPAAVMVGLFVACVVTGFLDSLVNRL